MITDTVYKYGSHKLQEIKVFKYDDSASDNDTLIYIHGGAWRDPNYTYDHLEPVVDLPHVNLIGINYRLSPEIKHPEHLIDILRALKYIKDKFNVDRLVILGHSVGATTILQLLHFRKIIELGLKYSEQKEDLQELFDEIETKVVFKKVVFLDGIYDVVDLLNEYPDYASFVNDAFVSSDHIKHATQLSFNYKEPFSLVTTKTQFLIYQSLQDELLSMKQTQLFVSYLAKMNQGFSLHTGNWGEHEDIYGKDRKVIFNGDVPTE